MPGMEANAKCDASGKGDGGSGRGAEAVVEQSLLSGGGVTVRSVQLHMLRCDMQRSRALVAAVLPKAVGTWFVGAMEELEREQPSDEALLSAGGAPAGGGRHGFPAMEDDLDEFDELAGMEIDEQLKVLSEPSDLPKADVEVMVTMLHVTF